MSLLLFVCGFGYNNRDLGLSNSPYLFIDTDLKEPNSKCAFLLY